MMRVIFCQLHIPSRSAEETAMRRTPVATTVIVALALASSMARPTLAADADVTYSRDVAPILFDNCVVCHREGDIAPMALGTYEETRPWAKSIQRAVVRDRTMPPWHSTDPRGTFANDRRLGDREIATIDEWIRAGAPEGDPADLPEPPEFQEEWRLGEPDYVIEYRRGLGAGRGSRPVQRT